jgi:hypothetical protein
MSLDIFDRFEPLLGTGYLVSPRQSLWQESESFLVNQLVGSPSFRSRNCVLGNLSDTKFNYDVDWNFDLLLSLWLKCATRLVAP